MEDTNYTPKQVAKILNMDYTKTLLLIKSGEIEAFNISTGKINPRWRVSKTSLDNFIQSRTNG